MADITKATVFSRGIALGRDDNVGIFQGNNDPSGGVGEAAPIGSIFLRDTGEIWQKTSAPDVGWTKLDAVSNSNLDDLSDVELTSIQDGDVIIYNSGTGEWENVPLQVPNSGRIVQVQFGPISFLAGTASIPKDTSLPLITEGAEIWSQTITPTDAANIIRLNSSVVASASNSAQELIFAAYRNSTCIGVTTDAVSNRDETQVVSFTFYDAPATAAQVTYSVRTGKVAGKSGSWYVNTLDGFTPGTEYGGVLVNNAYTVEELTGA